MSEKISQTTSENNLAVDDSFSPLFGTAKDVIQRYTHCVLCGANLHFTHVTNFMQNLTQETAKCPECGIKVRQAVHRLQ